MSLYRLAYYSNVVKGFRKDDIREILAKSVLNNQRDGLTGALAFTHEVFLQVLEGPRESLNITFRRIWADKRHSGVSLIGLEPITERAFERWSMAYVADGQATNKVLLKYCSADRMVPDYFTLQSTIDFMKEALG